MIIEYQGIHIDRLSRRVQAGERLLTLTATEYRLLEQLITHPGQSFSRQELRDSVIAGGAVVLERTIDKHIQGLRGKLGAYDLIETVRGVGYRCRADRAADAVPTP